MPFARTVTMSFVEVSPSIDSILKLFLTSLERAFCSISDEIATSVVRNTSIVAILGWIMPLPLAIPPMRQVFPPSSNSTASCFSSVSVVMIASQAAVLPPALSPAASAGTAAAMGAISSFWPITPVEATTMSSGLSPSSRAASPLIFSAISMPSALQVLALPLLQMTACALPSERCRLVTMSGAPLTRFVVYTAAALAFTSLKIIARSFL